MSQVLVRNIDPETLASLKERARGNGRSLQAELRLILTEAAQAGADEFWNAAEVVRERLSASPQTDSADLVREDRDR